MAQVSPIQSWNLIGPWVVSASKLGAMEPSLSEGAIGYEGRDVREQSEGRFLINGSKRLVGQSGRFLQQIAPTLAPSSTCDACDHVIGSCKCARYRAHTILDCILVIRDAIKHCRNCSLTMACSARVSAGGAKGTLQLYQQDSPTGRILPLSVAQGGEEQTETASRRIVRGFGGGFHSHLQEDAWSSLCDVQRVHSFQDSSLPSQKEAYSTVVNC